MLGGSLAAPILEEDSLWYWAVAVPAAVLVSVIGGWGVALWAAEREPQVLVPLVAALGAAMLAAGASLRMIRNQT